ncbi:MAG TPA: hypothetical protein VGR34_06525 [Candidatus Dormibacteraeota bacterium]|nr:hypothetical protein [Candidatus Dormibacteraeota bacterium]
MTNRQAAAYLQEERPKRLKQLFGPKFAEAVALGIAALKHPLLSVNHKREGAKGGKVRSELYSSKDFKKWGKMGGRPKKKK